MTVYLRYTEDDELEGPFETVELADAYASDAGCDDSDYTLVDATELSGSEKIAAPRMKFLDVRIQINNLHPSTNALELLRKALADFNAESPTGATLYIAES